MRELYDPIRTAALFKEAREIITALDSELRDIAAHVRCAFDDDQSGGVLLAAPSPRAIAVPTSGPQVPGKPFWKFWR